MNLSNKLAGQSVFDHDLPLWIMSNIKEYRINHGHLVFEIAVCALVSEPKNLSMLSKQSGSYLCGPQHRSFRTGIHITNAT
jgi:hypothetical protein